MRPDWRKWGGSLCVALAGLAALLGLGYALIRLRPETAIAAVPFFIAYGLIVWGMIGGLTHVEMVSRWRGALTLTVVESSNASTAAGISGRGG